MNLNKHLRNICERVKYLCKYYTAEYDSNDFAGELPQVERISGHLAIVEIDLVELKSARKQKKEIQQTIKYIDES